MADVLAAPANMVSSVKRPVGFVIQGGLITTALTLGFLYYLAHIQADFNPMGLYLDYVLPMGAALVGLAAGSGYGVGSYISGMKIQKKLLVTVILLQVIAYLAAEYIAYLEVMNQYAAQHHFTLNGNVYNPARFFRYFHYKTVAFAWKHEHDSGVGDALGMWGYFFVLLAAAGFVLGGLMAPLICLSKPYCDGCQTYMKTKRLGLIPASLKAVKKSKQDAAYQQNQLAAANAAQQRTQTLSNAAAAGDAATFLAASSSAFGPSRDTNKLPVRLRTDLIHCPACRRGWIRHTGVRGHGKQEKSQVLSKTEINSEFTRAVLSPTTA